jgi:hypothetical protein
MPNRFCVIHKVLILTAEKLSPTFEVVSENLRKSLNAVPQPATGRSNNLPKTPAQSAYKDFCGIAMFWLE